MTEKPLRLRADFAAVSFESRNLRQTWLSYGHCSPAFACRGKVRKLSMLIPSMAVDHVAIHGLKLRLLIDMFHEIHKLLAPVPQPRAAQSNKQLPDLACVIVDA